MGSQWQTEHANKEEMVMPQAVSQIPGVIQDTGNLVSLQ